MWGVPLEFESGFEFDPPSTSNKSRLEASLPRECVPTTAGNSPTPRRMLREQEAGMLAVGG